MNQAQRNKRIQWINSILRRDNLLDAVREELEKEKEMLVLDSQYAQASW